MLLEKASVKTLPFHGAEHQSQAAVPSDQLLLVDHQLELQSQLLRRLAAEKHPSHEDLKVVHDGTIFGVYGQLQLDQSMLSIDLQLGYGDTLFYKYTLNLLRPGVLVK